MSRRKTWDVDDPNRLRGSLETNDKIVDDEYFTKFVPAVAMHPVGATAGVISNVWPALAFTPSADREAHWIVDFPLHWRHGRLSVMSYWLHNNGVGSAVASLDMVVESLAVGSPVPYNIVIANVDEDVVLESGGSLNQVLGWERSSLAIRDRGDDVMISGRVGREGTDIDDTYVGNLYLFGVLLTWKPEPR